METHPTIIVRAFGDEPIILMSHGIGDGGYVQVSKPGMRDPVLGWPPDDAFEYSDWTFTKLKRAFDDGNKQELARLYSETPLLVKPEPRKGKRDEPCAMCGDLVQRKVQWKCAGKIYHEICFPQELLP